jgi:hypothetical protein
MLFQSETSPFTLNEIAGGDGGVGIGVYVNENALEESHVLASLKLFVCMRSLERLSTLVEHGAFP